MFNKFILTQNIFLFPFAYIKEVLHSLRYTHPFLKFCFIILYRVFSAHHVQAVPWRPHDVDPLGIKLWMTVSHHMGLGIEPASSARTSASNHQAISPAPTHPFY